LDGRESSVSAQSPASPERIDDAVLADPRSRLPATLRVRLPAGTGWGRGTDADCLADLIGYWADEYDWRPHEDRILALPWDVVTVGDPTVRAIHQKSPGATDTVVLVHGRSDSVLRFAKVRPKLADVNVMVPCLPGFPFAPPLTRTGLSATMTGATAAVTSNRSSLARTC
jgi:hypothetical protein